MYGPNCHSRGSSMPASKSKSLQSFTSAEMFPKAHKDCSRTVSSLLFAISSISSGNAPVIQHDTIQHKTIK